jgi:hypothetical protein
MLGSLHQRSNAYIANNDSPAYQRYQELARVAGVSRAFTLSVKLGLYTLLQDVKDKEGKMKRGMTSSATHLREKHW